MAGDKPLIEDERFREKVAAVEVELKALEMTQMRVLVRGSPAQGHGCPNPKSSILKIKGSEIQQATTELLLEIAGPLALPYQAEADDPEFGSNEPPVDLDWAAPAAPALLQLPQDHDLRRLQRDPAQHPRQGRAGLLMIVSRRCLSPVIHRAACLPQRQSFTARTDR